MGVQGLWSLLQCTGRPVTLESLEGKILAVDVSIWINQLVKGMRDRHGNAVPNAHLLGLYTRLCKLLYYRIKPVFVFDGGVPLLKKQTLAARRQKREEATESSSRMARKLLRTMLKQHAVSTVLGTAPRSKATQASSSQEAQAAPGTSQESTEDSSQPRSDPRRSISPVKKLSDANRKPDIFELTPLPEPDRPEGWTENHEESEEEMDSYVDPEEVDIESEDFKSLPPKMQHEILTDLKEARKRNYNARKHMPAESIDFSQYQVAKLMKQNSLSRRIDNVRKEINSQGLGDITKTLSADHQGSVVESRRVISDDSSHYILIKGLKKPPEGATTFDEKESPEKQNTSSVKLDPETTSDTIKDDASRPISIEFTAQGVKFKDNAKLNDADSAGGFVKETETKEAENPENVNCNPVDVDNLERSGPSDQNLSETTDKVTDTKVEDKHELDPENSASHVTIRSNSSSLNGDVIEIEDDSSNSSNSLTIVRQESSTTYEARKEMIIDITGQGEAGRRTKQPKVVNIDSDEDDKEQCQVLPPVVISGIRNQECSPVKVLAMAYRKRPLADRVDLSSDEGDDMEIIENTSRNSEKTHKNTLRISENSELSEVIQPNNKNEEIVVDRNEGEDRNDKEKGDQDILVNDGDSLNNTEETKATDMNDMETDSSGKLEIADNSKKVDSVNEQEQRIIEQKDRNQADIESGVKEIEEKGTENVATASPKEVTQSSTKRVLSETDFDQMDSNKRAKAETGKLLSGKTPSPRSRLNSETGEASEESDDDFMEITIDPKTAQPDDELFPLSVFTLATTSSEVVIQKPAHMAEKSEKEIVQVGNSDDENETIDLEAQGNTLDEAEAAGIPPDEAEAAGIPPDEAEAAGIPPDEVEAAGIPPDEAEAAGIPPDEDVIMLDNEFEGMSQSELVDLQEVLQQEKKDLTAQRGQQERIGTTITDQMYIEAQELLDLFGVPYIISPMEAEAQCAYLDLTNQTQGTITDDSDIWLFGGKRVYKNFFNQQRHVEFFTARDIEKQLLLTRERHIQVALMCGSDYTDGIQGVGPITALEILGEFPGPGLRPLKALKEWWDSVQKQPKSFPTTKVRTKLRTLHIKPGFPSEAVVEAYLHPTVDDSEERMSWSRPDLDFLRNYAEEKFGWTRMRTDEILLPVLKKLNETQAQMRITSYVLVRSEEEKSPSKRVRRVVDCMKRQQSESTQASPSPKNKAISSLKPDPKRSLQMGGGWMRSSTIPSSSKQEVVLSESSSDSEGIVGLSDSDDAVLGAIDLDAIEKEAKNKGQGQMSQGQRSQRARRGRNRGSKVNLGGTRRDQLKNGKQSCTKASNPREISPQTISEDEDESLYLVSVSSQKTGNRPQKARRGRKQTSNVKCITDTTELDIISDEESQHPMEINDVEETIVPKPQLSKPARSQKARRGRKTSTVVSEITSVSSVVEHSDIPACESLDVSLTGVEQNKCSKKSQKVRRGRERASGGENVNTTLKPDSVDVNSEDEDTSLSSEVPKMKSSQMKKQESQRLKSRKIPTVSSKSATSLESTNVKSSTFDDPLTSSTYQESLNSSENATVEKNRNEHSEDTVTTKRVKRSNHNKKTATSQKVKCSDHIEETTTSQKMKRGDHIKKTAASQKTKRGDHIKETATSQKNECSHHIEEIAMSQKTKVDDHTKETAMSQKAKRGRSTSSYTKNSKSDISQEVPQSSNTCKLVRNEQHTETPSGRGKRRNVAQRGGLARKSPTKGGQDGRRLATNKGQCWAKNKPRSRKETPQEVVLSESSDTSDE